MADIGLYEAMSTLRAVRKLRPDPIPADVMQRVLQAAAWAPSGGNRQPWRMIAVEDPQLKARIGELYKAEWAPFAGQYRENIAKIPDQVDRAKQTRTIDAGDRLADHLGEVPAIIIVCFNPNELYVADAKLDRVPVVGGGSIYLAVQNLMLACRAEGLGCVLTTLLCHAEPTVKELLGIPDDWYTAAMVPIGYPISKGHGPISRKPVREMVFRDRWDQGYE